MFFLLTLIKEISSIFKIEKHIIKIKITNWDYQSLFIYEILLKKIPNQSKSNQEISVGITWRTVKFITSH